MSLTPPVRQHAIDIAADYCERLKVHEVGGNNHGPNVTKFLRWVGLGEGYPWCAAFVSWCLHSAGWDVFKSAAVIFWHSWAKAHKCLHSDPALGAVAHLLHGETGHEAIVIDIDGEYVITAEGNTSPGESGSQREGDGCFIRRRHKSFWNQGFIYWWEVA